jgi:hypothetical protein
MITVTLDGSDGRFRDYRTATSPIFGSRSRPADVTQNRALRVNRIAGRVRVLPGAEPVVEHYPGTPERPGQGLRLPGFRVQAVVVPKLHAYRISEFMVNMGT